MTVSAGALIAAYAANEGGADEKYKEKALTLTNATVESKTGDAVFLVGAKGAKAGLKIKVAYAGDFKKQLENLKPGDRVSGKVKGEGAGMFNGTIYLNGAWFAP